jgi:hypothetical protein
MIKYMSVDVGKTIIRYYKTHATTHQQTWKPNPLEDKVEASKETPEKTSNKKRKNGSPVLMTNPYTLTPPMGVISFQGRSAGLTGSTYHSHAWQANKVLSQAMVTTPQATAYRE